MDIIIFFKQILYLLLSWIAGIKQYFTETVEDEIKQEINQESNQWFLTYTNLLTILITVLIAILTVIIFLLIKEKYYFFDSISKNKTENVSDLLEPVRYQNKGEKYLEKILFRLEDLISDNVEKLQELIDLILVNAMKEPNISPAYAHMCKDLISILSNFAKYRGRISFGKLLFIACQNEFETFNSFAVLNSKMSKESDIADRKIRIMSAGNIRFIGELFKQRLLSANIMFRYMNILLNNKNEYSLENLCELLMTIGEELEQQKKQELSNFFDEMQEIVDKTDDKYSIHIRPLLQNVINLKNSKWIPRYQNLNVEKIQNENSGSAQQLKYFIPPYSQQLTRQQFKNRIQNLIDIYINEIIKMSTSNVNLLRTEIKSCTHCKYIPKIGITCYVCDSYYHYSCANLYKGVKIDRNFIQCCETKKEVEKSNAENCLDISYDALKIENKYLKEIIKDRDVLIDVLTQTLKSHGIFLENCNNVLLQSCQAINSNQSNSEVKQGPKKAHKKPNKYYQKNTNNIDNNKSFYSTVTAEIRSNKNLDPKSNATMKLQVALDNK